MIRDIFSDEEQIITIIAYLFFAFTNAVLVIAFLILCTCLRKDTLISFFAYVEGYYFNYYKNEVLPARIREKQRDLTRKKIKFKDVHKRGLFTK